MSDDLPNPGIVLRPPEAAAPDPDARPAHRLNTHPNFWWAILWCVGLVLATQVPGGVAAVVILLGWMVVNREQVPPDAAGMFALPVGQVALAAAVLVAHGLILVFSLVALRVVAGPSWHRQVAWRLPAWHHVPLVVALWPGFAVLGGATYYFVRHVLRVPSMSDTGLGGMEEMVRVFKAWPIPVGVFLIGVLPGLSEELWCRAFLGRGLVATHGYVLGILGTSFLFGLIHVDPAQGLMAVAMGVALHAVYQLTRSLWMPMLLHFLNNSLSIVLTHVPRADVLDNSFSAAHGVVYAGAAVVVAAGMLALYQGRARLWTVPGAPAWEPPAAGVWCPPPDGPTRVVAPLPEGWTLLLLAGGFGVMAVGLWWVLR